MVPITSDLAGYEAFWARALAALAALFLAGQVPAWVLLYLIWRKP